MRQSIKQRRRHLGIAKDLPPLGKAQIGRDHHAGALIQLGSVVSQRFSEERELFVL